MLATMLFTICWSLAQGFEGILSGGQVTGVWSGAFLILAAFCRWRRGDRLVTGLLCFVQLLLFVHAFCPLMYLVGTIGRPFVDEQLAACDAWLFFNSPAAVAWQSRHPIVGDFLQFCYDSIINQTFIVMSLASLLNDTRFLESFVLRFMLAALLTVGIFALWPAEGPFRQFEFQPSAEQARYLTHLHELRSGTRDSLRLGETAGLVTFPSFHTTWAILLALVFRHRKWLAAPLILLNVFVVVATLTSGWHYLSDVLAGACVVGMVVPLARWLEGPLSSASPKSSGTAPQKHLNTSATRDNQAPPCEPSDRSCESLLR